MADFEGLTIRGPTKAVADCVEAFGATPITMGGGDVYTSNTLTGLAHIALFRGQLHRAEEMLKQALGMAKFNENTPPMHLLLSVVYHYWNDLEGAAAEREKVNLSFPIPSVMGSIYLYTTGVCLTQGDIEGAAEAVLPWCRMTRRPSHAGSINWQNTRVRSCTTCPTVPGTSSMRGGTTPGRSSYRRSTNNTIKRAIGILKWEYVSSRPCYPPTPMKP